ncbi:MAG: GAF domain-containing protein [Chloroflexi bacterium]|nr:GAF domain-containing protein [Chloroflexota bacterium]
MSNPKHTPTLQPDEDLYRLLLSSIQTPVLALDEDMTILYCNEAYAKFIGLPLAEIESQNLLALFPHLVGSPSHQAYLQVLETGQTQQAGGRLGDRIIRATVYRTPWGILSIAEDVTEHEQLLRTLERRALQLQTAAEVSQAASSILDPDELVQNVVDLVRERFDLYYVGLFLVDDEGEAPGKWAVLRAGTGPAGQQMIAQGHKLEVGGDSMIGWCIANRHARIALDVGAEAVRFDNPALPQTRSELALPLISREQVIGAMTVQSEAPQAFTPEDIDNLQTMADQLATAIENARLFANAQRAQQEEQRRAAQLTALLDNIPDTIYFKDTASRFTLINPAQAQALGIADPQEAVGKTDLDFWAEESAQTAYADEQQIVASAQPMIGQVEKIVRKEDGQVHWFSATKIPLIDEAGQVTGLVGISRDITDLQTAQEAAQQHAQEQEGLAKIAALGSSTLDLDKLLTQLVGETARLVGAQTTVLLLLDQEEKALIGRYFSTDGQLTILPEEWHIPLDTPGFEHSIFARGSAYFSNQAETDPNIIPAYRLHMDYLKVKTFCGVPLRVRDRSIGELYLVNRPGGFGPDQLRVLRTAADYAATAIENARLFNQTQTALAEAQALYRAGRFLISFEHVDQVLQAVVDGVAEALPANRVALIAFDQARRQVTNFAKGGPGSDQITQVPFEELWDGLSGWVLRELTPALSPKGVPDPRESPDVQQRRAGTDCGAIIVTPLYHRGETLGTLTAINRADEPDFTQRDIDLMEALANQAVAAIRNAQLFEERTRRTEELAALRELSLELVEAQHDRKAMLTLISSQAMTLLNADGGGVWLWDKSTQELVLEHTIQVGDIDLTGRRLKPGEGLVGRVLVEKQLQVIDDYQAWADRPAHWDDAPFHAALGVPLLWQNQAIGVLAVTRSQTQQPFDTMDQRLSELLAGQIAVFVENARLFQERERRIAELDAINRMGQALALALEPDELLAAVHEHVRLLFDTTNFYIATYREGSDEWTAVFDIENGERLPRSQYDVRSGLTGHIIRTGRPALFRTQQEALAFDQEHGLAAVGPPPKSWLGVPLIAAGKVVGVMAIQSYAQEQLYDERDLTIFSTVANRAAAAIENLRLLEETRHRAQEMEVINDVGRTLTTMLDPDEVLRQIVDTTKERFGHYFVGLALVEDDQIAFRYGSLMGDTGVRMEPGGVVLDLHGPGLNPEAARTGQPILVGDVRADSRFVQALGLPGTRSELVVPIEVKGRVIGTLDVQSDRLHAFDETDVALLQSLVSQAGVAIENARLFQERQRRITELAMLNEIGQAVSATLELDTLLDTVLKQVSRLFDTTNFYVAMYRADTDEWASPLHLEHGEPQPVIWRKVQAGLTGYIIRNRQSLHFETTAAVRAFQQSQGIASIGQQALSWMGVPLIAADKVVGVMAIQNYQREHLYSEQDLALFSTVADRIAIALENLRLLDEARIHAAELATLNELGQALAARLDVDQVLEETYRGVSRLVDTTNFYIGLYNPQTHEITFPLNVTESVIEKAMVTIPADQGISAYVLRHRTSVLIKTGLAGWLQENGVELVGEPGRSWLGVPLMIGDQMLGLMAVQDFKSDYVYDEHDQDMLTAIASQTAIAIQNARLFEEAQQSSELLGERVQELDVLNDIGRQIDQTPPVSEFLQWVAGRIPSAMRYPTACTAAIEYDGAVYGSPEAVNLPNQIVQSVRVGDQVAGQVYIAYREHYEFPDGASALMGDIVRRVSGYIENRRLVEQTQTRAQELVVLNELARALSASLSVDDVLAEVHQGVSHLVDTANFYIALHDPKEAVNRFVFQATESEIDRNTLTVLPQDQGITGYIVRNRTSVLLKDNVTQWMEEMGIPAVGEPARSWLGVPLMLGEQVLGVMAVQDYTQSYLYDEHDRDMLTAIASQAAIAIQNARLFEETKAALTETEILAREQAVLNELAQALTARLDMDAILEEAYRGVSRLLTVSNFYIAFYDEVQDTITFAFDVVEGQVSKPYRTRQAGQGMTEYVIRHRVPVLVKEDLNGWRQEKGVDRLGTVSPTGALSWLGVPLIVGKEVIGVMAMQDYAAAGTYDEHDRDLLTAIASQAAIAIQNARLFEQIQSTLTETEQLYEASRRLTSASDMQEAVAAVAEELRIPGINRMVMWRLDHDEAGQPVALFSLANWYSGTGPRPLPLGVRFPLSQFLAIHLALTQEPVLIQDTLTDDRLDPATREAFRQQQVRGLALLPLQIGARQIGTLMFVTEEPRHFADHEIRSAVSLTSQMAVVIENRRLFEQTQSALTETESLYQASRAINEATSTAGVGAALTAYASTTGNLDSARLLLFERDAQGQPTRIDMQQWWRADGQESSQPIGTILPLSDYPLTDLMDKNQPIMVEDVLADPRANDSTRLIISTISSLRSFVMIPIATEQRWIGMLFIARAQPSTWPADLIRAYRTLAGQAAVALEGQTLLAEAERRANQEQILREITVQLQAAVDADTIARTAVRRLGAALNRPTFVRLGNASELAVPNPKPDEPSQSTT